MTWNDVLTVVNSGDTLLGLAFLLYLGWRLWGRVRGKPVPVTFTITPSEAKRTNDLLLAYYGLDVDVIDSEHGSSRT